MIPFDGNSALWSDGASKERWMAIPNGTTITVTASGDFDFPNGTVLAKTFRIGGQRIETRLFMKHLNGNWAGYSYEWNQAETEATLLSGAKSRVVGSQTWNYPSRGQCMQCHTAITGRALGPEIGQLNSAAAAFGSRWSSCARRASKSRRTSAVKRPSAERAPRATAPSPLRSRERLGAKRSR